MSISYHVAKLGSEGAGSVDSEPLSAAFGTPWRRVSIVQVGPGEALGPIAHPDSELLIYVLSGAGEARVAGADVRLAAHSSLAVLQGESIEILQRGASTLRLFLAEVGLRSNTESEAPFE